MGTLKRREFLKAMAWTGLGATVAAGAVPLGAILLPPPAGKAGGPSRILLGPLSEFPPGSSAGKLLQGKPVIAFHGSTGIMAVSSRCTHLGCLVNWNAEAEEIRCPCHGGRFDCQGKVLGGPPPTSLEVIPVSIEDGQVWIGV